MSLNGGKLNALEGTPRLFRTVRCRFGATAQSTVVPWLLWVLCFVCGGSVCWMLCLRGVER